MVTHSAWLQVVYSDTVKTGQPRAAAMLMTSATVHAGASGGAVVTAGGCIAGLVTSNARFSSSAILPNLNFAVAAAALRPLWALAQTPQGLTCDALQSLDVKDDALGSLWKLTAPPEKQGLSEVGRLKGSATERLAGLLSKSGLAQLGSKHELKLPTSRL